MTKLVGREWELQRRPFDIKIWCYSFCYNVLKKKRTSRIKEIFKKKENVIDKEFENYIKYQNKIIKINIDDKILHNDYKEKQAT